LRNYVGNKSKNERVLKLDNLTRDIIKLFNTLSVEELLEAYKDAEAMLGKPEASLTQLLIVAELEKRIYG